MDQMKKGHGLDTGIPLVKIEKKEENEADAPETADANLASGGT